jgi:hypothetical protein
VQAILILALLGSCFFGSLIWSADHFPGGYDWRHTVMSSLSSPRDNPHGYRVACVGLALSGVFLLLFPRRLDIHFRAFAPRLSLWAGRFLILGAIALFLAAVIVPGHYRILGIGRSHEHLAEIASVALCLALILYFVAMLRLPTSFRPVQILSLFVVVLPVTTLIVSRLALFYAYQFSPVTVYRAIRSSLWSSLGLWEWIGALSLYCFLALLTLTPVDSKPPGVEE